MASPTASSSLPVNAPPNQPVESIDPAGLQPDNDSPSQPQRPPFTPLFPLIRDSSHPNVQHPVLVHYVFSDDDQDVVTSACLDSLANRPAPADHHEIEESGSSGEGRRVARRSPPQGRLEEKGNGGAAVPQPENRTILIDLSPSGTSILSAHSLTPTWAVTSTTLTPAPTWDTASLSPNNADSRLMLTIEGTDGRDGDGLLESLKARDGKGKLGVEMQPGMVIEELGREFGRRMEMLRRVMGSGCDGKEGEEERDGDGDGDGDGAVDREGEAVQA